MRPRSRQQQLCLRQLVDQHPVRLDMQVTPTLPFAFERMVAELRFERRLLYQQQDHRTKLGHVPATLVRSLDVLLERRRTDHFAQRSDTQIVE